MTTYSMTGPDGKTYSIDGPPGATQEQVVAQLSAAHGNLAKSPEAPSSVVDAIRSIPGGLAKGVTALGGLPGDIGDAIGWGMKKLGIPTADPHNLPSNTTVPASLNGDNSADLSASIAKPFGGYYEPKTNTGKFVERASEFAPAAVGGEASLGQRVLGNVLGPAAGSLAGGSLVSKTDHPILHAALETGGALLGGGLASGARALGGALKDVNAPAEDVANKYVSQLLTKSGGSPGTVIANAVPGRGQMAAEAMGAPGIGALATLGRRPGSTGEALGAALSERSQSAPTRILADVAQASGIDPGAAVGNMENIVKSGRKIAAPLYDEALNAPPATTEYLVRFANDPDVKKGMAIGIRNAQREALSENKPFDPNAYAVSGFNEAGDPIVSGVPTWRTWDAAKNGLDEMLEAYRNPITKQLDLTKTGRAIEGVRSSLVDELDSMNPAYKSARDAAGDYLSANSAFKTGGDHLLNPGTTAKQVQDYFGRLNPSNQQAYQAGIANKLFNQAQNGRLRPAQLLTPAVQQKVTAAFGPDKAQNFITGLQQELALAKSGARMMPGANSITSDVLLNAGDQDASAGIRAGMHGVHAAGNLLQGNVLGAVGGGLTALKHFAPDLLKTGGMSAEARDQAGRLLMLPPDELAGHLRGMTTLPTKKSTILGQLLGRST